MCCKDGPIIKSHHGPNPQPPLVGGTLELMGMCLRKSLAITSSRAAEGGGAAFQ